jgi:uncharacterized membrane protein YphA (DoxX/SURF4 family)
VLRISLAVMLTRFGQNSRLISPFGLAAALAAVAGLLMLAGFLTRLVACFCGVAVVAGSVLASPGQMENAVLVSAVSFCVAALGPGSYSTDSLWFGRPKRIFPPD